jgi:hypothetical protein
MRRLLFFAIGYLGISLLACQDGTDENPFFDRDLGHYKNIGKQIPNETAVRWIETYRSREQEAGRLNLLSNYSVSASNLQVLLNSIDDLTGVAFHHAIDAYGQHHYVIIPVDETLNLWGGGDKQFLDANTNTFISAQTAQAWTENYELENPGEIWFHFFGANIFDDILAISYFETLHIEAALNDLNLSPQLLLIVLNDGGLLGGLLGGRVNEDEGAVYDASSPCPPCAVH